MYRTLERDVFPDTMSMTFGDMTVHYNKVTWEVDGEKKGLRYGDNPGQPSALYRPVNGNLVLAGLEFIGPGKGLVTELELLRSGKHPGNINLMDVDGALGILRFFTHTPTVAIMKHNNPCGVASRPTLREAYREANMADRVAAFGGAVAFNRAVDRDTAKEVMRSYSEVVVAPDYEEGVVDILEKRKDLRILRIGGMDRLHNWRDEVFPEIRSLCDGGIIVQTSYLPMIRTLEDIRREGVVPGDVPVRRSEGDRRVDTGQLGYDLVVAGRDGLDPQAANRGRVPRYVIRMAGGVGHNVQLGDIREGPCHRGHRHRRTGQGGRGRDSKGQGLHQAAGSSLLRAIRHSLQRSAATAREGNERGRKGPIVTDDGIH